MTRASMSKQVTLSPSKRKRKRRSRTIKKKVVV